MKTFMEYSDSFTITCNPEMLDFGANGLEYCIYESSSPLLTPCGNVFSHPSEAVIRLLVTDLQLFDDLPLKMLSSTVLFSFLNDAFTIDNDPFLHQWENLLASDRFVQFKTSGKASNQLFGSDDPLFSFSFITLTGLIAVINRFAERSMSEIVMSESDMHPFAHILKSGYARLAPGQKVAVQALSSVHHSGIVMPLLLVLDEISPAEYVKGLISLRILTKEQYSVNLAGVVRVTTFLGLLSQKHLQEKLASVFINEGECDSIEFKSTLRWDIRAGKSNPAIERACLKTISAFLNSNGGNLLIGVRDDGSIEGIVTDKFANEDKFLLHLWTLIRTCLGKDFCPYIHTRIEKLEEKPVCIVECQPSDSPAFLRQPGFDEEMYIRIGPSSNALDISEALKYIEHRFRNRSVLIP
ncbi:MAG: ATP-binding protein [Bacteroidota bacterium]